MAWRFKASKYKNATPKFLKKEENILDIPLTDVSSSCGNHIKSSCVYTVFNTDLGGGGSLGYLPHTAKGRQDNNIPLILAHSDFVTDFDFSPFDDFLLATGSQDNKVKLWLLPDEAATGNLSEPVLSFPCFDHRVDIVSWNPCADGILAVTSSKSLKIYDVTGAMEKEIFSFSNHGDQVQGISWQDDGSHIVTSCKDKKIRVIDVRANQVVQEGQGHQNVKDSRVLWLSGKSHIVSTGFSASRSREVCVWDSRNLSQRLGFLDLGSSTGTLMPFYDADTSMTFLVGKGDNSINYLEYTDKTPFLTANNVDRTEQIKGACLVPKRVMNLMDGEVNRFMLLCKKSILPVPYIIPRKSYRDFHEDIFPDTSSGYPGMTAEEWLKGETTLPPKVKLLPDKDFVLKERRGTLIGLKGSSSQDTSTSGPPKQMKIEEEKQPIKPIEPESEAQQSSGGFAEPVVKSEKVEEKPSQLPENSAVVQEKPVIPQEKPVIPQEKPVISEEKPAIPQEKPTIPPKVVKPFAGVRQSKCRHIQGRLEHPSCYYTNLKSVCTSMPGESDMFEANETRCAVPIDGAGGNLHILDFKNARRLKDTGEATIQNGSKVTDFAWDPFDNTRLVVTLDNAKINVWRIPAEGLTESLETPEFSLWGHMEKIFFVNFHPLVSDLIATASYDMTIRLWDLKERKEVKCFEVEEDQQVFCLSWSQDGRFFATVNRDKKLRVYDPRQSSTPIKEGQGPDGTRGARIVWVLDDKYLIVTGFDKSSCQEITIYSSDNLKLLNRLPVVVSPAILIPHYDPDCSVLYITSRGERTIYTFEVADEKPYLFECSSFKTETVHQGVSYMWKNTCDVKSVEVAKAWRLTLNSAEALTFTIPRVKPEYFQDDLYPDTRVLWKPTISAEEWLAGKDKKPDKLSLRPKDMKLLSEAPIQAPKTKKFESYNAETFKTDTQKKEELLNAMVGKLEISNDPLPQDLAEGVDDDEWDD